LLPGATSDAPDVEIPLPALTPAELYETPIDMILPVNVPGVTVVELGATVEFVPEDTVVVVNVLTLVNVISDDVVADGIEKHDDIVEFGDTVANPVNAPYPHVLFEFHVKIGFVDPSEELLFAYSLNAVIGNNSLLLSTLVNLVFSI
jgi:hypothetical protein